MRLAIVGLGRMGAGMAERLVRGGHEVVGFDVSDAAREAVATKGVAPATTLAEAVGQLSPPRVVWLMLPAGPVVDEAIRSLSSLLGAGDVVVDGGNSNYKDAIAAAEALGEHGVGFIDAGVSGGVWGLTEGYCLMVGGAPKSVATVEPLFRALAPEDGYAHVGPVGAGHFVKMVHNGIEYGLMQAYAEGFELMRAASDFSLDLREIAGVWRHGSVVRSWLLDLTERALAADIELSGVKGWVEDSGEGRWTVEEAVARGVPAPVITASLYARFASRAPDAYQAKLLAALRNQFGGHAIQREG